MTEALTYFNRALEDFQLSSESQRNEILLSFIYMSGRSLLDVSDRRRKSTHHVPLVAPIVRQIAGGEAMKERQISILCLDDLPESQQDNDVVDKAVEWAQIVSGWKSEYDKACRDAGACGIGATITYSDSSYKDLPYGLPSVKRIYPGFMFWDTSVRGGDLNKNGNYCGFVEPMRRQDLQKHIEEKLGKRKVKTDGLAFSGQYDSIFRNMISTQNDLSIEFLYQFFWREKVKVWDVKNPLMDEKLAPLLKDNDLILAWFAELKDSSEASLDAPLWVLDAEDWKEYQKTMDAVGKIAEIELKAAGTTRDVWCYYRAEIAAGMVLEESKSFVQDRFPMNFITGYYDESLSVWYGFCRPLSYIQDAIDTVMTNLVDAANTTRTGGKVFLQGGSKEALALFIKQKEAEEDVSVLPAGTTTIPRGEAASPQLLLETARMLIELLPRAIGVGQEFLGVITTGEMTDSLYGRIVRQSFAVVADFMASSAGASRNQGHIFLALMFSSADASGGLAFEMVSPDRKAVRRVLEGDEIRRKYTVHVVEQPVSDDEKRETLKSLVQLAPVFMQAGVNIVPAIIKAMPMDYDVKQELMQYAMPQPQEPDQMTVESAQANIDLLRSQAYKLQKEADLKEKQSLMEIEKIRSEIIENLARASK
jgi:hypothetical protein